MRIQLSVFTTKHGTNWSIRCPAKHSINACFISVKYAKKILVLLTNSVTLILHGTRQIHVGYGVRFSV